MNVDNIFRRLQKIRKATAEMGRLSDERPKKGSGEKKPIRESNGNNNKSSRIAL